MPALFDPFVLRDPASPAYAGPLLPKVCGADFELGNFVAGICREGGTGHVASQLLLREIEGTPASSAAAPPAAGAAEPSEEVPRFTSQDWGRKFLPNGGSAYIDLWHLELCIPEVRSAREYLAYTNAGYRMAAEAARAASRRLPEEHPVVASAENSDGHGQSFGSHLNVLVADGLWRRLCGGCTLEQEFLAAFQVSSPVVCGLGKVGAENGAPSVGYQISQRADFIETLCSVETTRRRPIVNSRHEPHCGRTVPPGGAGGARPEAARLHVISYDANLCHTAGFLKVGALQLILALLEAGGAQPGLVLEDPIGAMRRWSHDPLLRHRERLAQSGESVTAVDLQWRFWELAQRFVASGAAAAVVPEAGTIVELWGDTLQRLARCDWESLRRRLDWVLKLSLLAQARERSPALDWSAPELKHLDHLYAVLGPRRGLYWNFMERGLVDRLVSENLELFAMWNPPEDTRAWSRSQLLTLAGPGEITRIDWDYVEFSLARTQGAAGRRTFRVHLPDPLAATRAQVVAAVGPDPDLAALFAALPVEELTNPVWQGVWAVPAASVAVESFGAHPTSAAPAPASPATSTTQPYES